MVARHKSKQQKTQINQQNVLHEKCCSCVNTQATEERTACATAFGQRRTREKKEKNNPKKGQEGNCENDRADANRTRARFSVFKSNMGFLFAIM